jgi:hypothetical protein
LFYPRRKSDWKGGFMRAEEIATMVMRTNAAKLYDLRLP